MTPKERNKYLYENKALLPYQRKELILEHLEKAKALIEQELIWDKLYNQMGYETMSNLDKDRLTSGVQKLNHVILKVIALNNVVIRDLSVKV